ncbi:hypothetical protein B0T18DRAFT_421284 [Schizothecium vesticola]|uniref:Mtf2-like C-terminal domain-containing protein n=1 Tax=Schizothecium vesticola TaxID=314040 RepID=A0AA40EE54_9PEZI|nr:hypothetical protein B0T18DRAFT_421284 [Schizothecium vesticola]
MPATLLPFLYQTRTLQRAIATPLLRAFFHATATARTDSREPPPRNQRLRGAARTAAQRASPDAIPFSFGPDQGQFGQEDAEDAPPGHEATITPLEQETFSRIFDEIASRGLRPRSIAAAPEKEPRHGIGASSARVEGDEEKAKLAINIVLQDAAATQNQSWRPIIQPFDPLSPVGQLASTADQTKALLRFPPSLRRAARMALGVFEADRRAAVPFLAPEVESIPPPWEDQDTPGLDQVQPEAKDYTTRSTLARTVEQESIRRIERRRVEQIMRDAKTDFELWDVLEAHVFPMVDKLGLMDKKKAPKASAKGGQKKAAAEEPVQGQEPTLSMRIHGPLYPYFLLSALRMLDSSFTKSSPLALNLLPRIKELGLMSYVLGASTPFYNALATIQWNRYGNAEAVFNLLEEMRHAGLYCDEGTFSVVHSISHVFNKARTGNSGPFLKELVSLPDYEYAIRPRIKHWFTAVSIQIQEKRRDLEVSGKIPAL